METLGGTGRKVEQERQDNEKDKEEEEEEEDDESEPKIAIMPARNIPSRPTFPPHKYLHVNPASTWVTRCARARVVE